MSAATTNRTTRGKKKPAYSYGTPAMEALNGVLDEIEDYLEQRQDVRDGPDGPRPNTEMSLLSDLRWWRSAAGLAATAQREPR